MTLEEQQQEAEIALAKSQKVKVDIEVELLRRPIWKRPDLFLQPGGAIVGAVLGATIGVLGTWLFAQEKVKNADENAARTNAGANRLAASVASPENEATWVKAPKEAPAKTLKITFNVVGTDHTGRTPLDIVFGTTAEVVKKAFTQSYKDYPLRTISAAAKESTVDESSSIATVKVTRISAHDGSPQTYALLPSVTDDGKTVRVNYFGEARQSFVDTWEMTVGLVKLPAP